MADLSNSLAQLMMRRIISGQCPVGSLLPKESELCEEHGCSRVVVREAKKRLQALGMVRPLKRAGSYIQPRHEWNFFSSDLFGMYLEAGEDVIEQIENFYSLRLLLEPELAAEVAVAHSAEFLTDMEAILARLEEAHKNPSSNELLTIDLDFHMRIYRESKNILFMPLAKLMRSFFLFSFHHARSEWTMGFAEHRDVVCAMAENNPEEARGFTATLIRNGRERFRMQIEEYKKENKPLRFSPEAVLGS
jgi:Transcriptional regulators